MRILIDIGHPAHVHYFKNFIKIMESKGHCFFITARDKEVAHSLLKVNNLKYVTRGRGSSNLFGKFLYIFKADYLLFKSALKFKPDLFLSFASPYAAHVSKLFGKPHITLDDTEHATLNHKLYVPFTDVILSPSCFYSKISDKQLFFNSYVELCYLHKDYFKPNEGIYSLLGLSKGEKYVILRFVSWDANHDIGQKGLSFQGKKKLINELVKHVKVFISSESPLPQEFVNYRLKIAPENLHDALSFASLYIGEGSTTASECSVLGTPNIYINSLIVGYCKEQAEKYKTCIHFTSEEGVLGKALEILYNKNALEEFKNNHEIMINDKINPTKFLVWFIENYPKSVIEMKINKDYEKHFN